MDSHVRMLKLCIAFLIEVNNEKKTESQDLNKLQ